MHKRSGAKRINFNTFSSQQMECGLSHSNSSDSTKYLPVYTNLCSRLQVPSIELSQNKQGACWDIQLICTHQNISFVESFTTLYAWFLEIRVGWFKVALSHFIVKRTGQKPSIRLVKSNLNEGTKISAAAGISTMCM